jgi:hypothetical protein
MPDEGIIHHLYTKNECEAIKFLYKEEPTLRKPIVETIGNKLVVASEKFVNTTLLNAIHLVCLTAKFADSEDECYRVAVTVCQFCNKTKDLLPSILEDRGIMLANKTLVCLSFFSQAMKKRWMYKGAPSPQFYRKLSKTIYESHGQKDISRHHEQWEAFLGERLI